MTNEKVRYKGMTEHTRLDIVMMLFADGPRADTDQILVATSEQLARCRHRLTSTPCPRLLVSPQHSLLDVETPATANRVTRPARCAACDDGRVEKEDDHLWNQFSCFHLRLKLNYL